MSIFYKKIEEICKKNDRVAMFIDMDGTIVEYVVYQDSEISTTSQGKFLNENPIYAVIENLKEISKIKNIDLYILSLAKSDIIVEEKRIWLKKYIDFIDEEKWIIVNKEKNEYNKENRDYIKAEKMKEKLMQYDKVILLDDDHKILKQTQKELKDKCNVFHLSSAII